MSGKTHAVIGATSALLILPTNHIGETILCASFGALGGLLLDIDTKRSKGAVIFRKIRLAVLILLSCAAFVSIFGTYSGLIQMIGSWNLLDVICLLGLFFLYWYATTTPHRAFTHSIEFVCFNGILFYWLQLPFYPAILIGEVAHILLDLLNKKDVTLSVLFQIKLSFNLAKADGMLDRILSFLGTVSVVFLSLVHII